MCVNCVCVCWFQPIPISSLTLTSSIHFNLLKKYYMERVSVTFKYFAIRAVFSCIEKITKLSLSFRLFAISAVFYIEKITKLSSSDSSNVSIFVHQFIFYFLLPCYQSMKTERGVSLIAWKISIY